MSIDCWLDKYKKTTFLGVTIHFIMEAEGKLKLHDRILCTRELHIEAKDGIYIRSKLLEYLTSFNLDSLVGDIVFVSDRGSNMKKAVEPFMNSHCFAHMLHNTIVKMFTAVHTIVDDVKSLVKYFKVTALNSALESALKSYIKTRWNTIYYMMKSVIENWNDVVSILTAKGEEHRMLNIDKNTLSMLCTFVEVFEIATMEIEASKSPTLHLVVPWYFKLMKHMQFVGVDSALVSDMKKIGREYLKNNIGRYISTYHKIAAFLYPETRSLKMYSREEKNAIIDSARDLMNTKFPKTANDSPRSERSLDQNETFELNRRKSRSISSALEMFRDDSGDDDDTDDIEKYISMHVRTENSGVDILTWWYDQKSKMPQLFKLAMFIFSIPASSAAVERVFSLAGLTIKNRPNLNPSTLDDLLLLKSNSDLFEATKDKVSE